MSEATKRKHVAREVLEDYPEPTGDQQIVRVLHPKGNNLHEVQEASGGTYLASMPTKFRKSIWVKRGDYVIVEPIAEGDKVKAEIIHILFPEQIRELQKDSKWPAAFSSKPQSQDYAGDLGMGDEDSEEGLDEGSQDENDKDGETGNTTTEPQMDAFGNYIGGEESSSEEENDDDEDE
eukprot:m.17972 g.17972  ORF g.17972 m.17972 type:complete len:178 (-) comp7252_c0_seq2:252-785(-)